MGEKTSTFFSPSSFPLGRQESQPNCTFPTREFFKTSTLFIFSPSPFFLCSAGVGRTGAYILIDAMLKQMKAKGELNLPAYLRHIRTQRNFLVQTEEQYIFVHDALAEAVGSGETNINRSYLSRYINSLQSSFTTDENSIPWQLLDRQFKLATAYQPQEVQFMAALKPCNQSKNQNFDFLPIESARVPLTPRPGEEGSDYINASWLPGFNRLKEFIITQHPSEKTMADFWQMLWDHNTRTVVVLSALQQPEFGIFWPNKQHDLDFASIRVTLTDELESAGYQTKVFTLLSQLDSEPDRELTVRLVFCPSWPHHCSPLATSTDLIRVVRNVHMSSASTAGGYGGPFNSPLVVVDRFGGTEAATFCALSTLLRQLDFENHVDVYQYAKVSHNRRPGIWKSQDDYLYLYRVVEAVCYDLEKKGGGGAPSNGGGGEHQQHHHYYGKHHNHNHNHHGTFPQKRCSPQTATKPPRRQQQVSPSHHHHHHHVMSHSNGHLPNGSVAGIRAGSVASSSSSSAGSGSKATTASSTASASSNYSSVRIPPDGMESAPSRLASPTSVGVTVTVGGANGDAVALRKGPAVGF